MTRRPGPGQDKQKWAQPPKTPASGIPRIVLTFRSFRLLDPPPPHQCATAAPLSGAAPTHGERLSFGSVVNLFVLFVSLPFLAFLRISHFLVLGV